MNAATEAGRYFATTPKGMEEVLADELRSLGGSGIEPTRAGIAFGGPLEAAYRACLWSRTASRVLLPLASFAAPGAEALYEGVRSIRWSEHLAPGGSLAVDFTSTESQLTHTHFGAQKVKDAIVDQLRQPSGLRPDVDLADPDLRVNVHLRKDVATVAVDLSGESLHRRGYRESGTRASLKENLAAAILLYAGWPATAEAGGGLVDPMCGSGTLPIEAALMALDVAPGLLRARFGLERWRGHDAPLWERLKAEARARDRRASGALPPLVGSDQDAHAIRVAGANARRAGVERFVQFEARELDEAKPVDEKPGLFVVNPPYGERLGDEAALRFLYRRIGDSLKQRFAGWTGAVFTANLELAKHVGLRAERRHVLYNGPLEARLLIIPVHAAAPAATRGEPAERAPWVEAFANRLRKDFRHLSKWARREGVTCYRVYDADLPEFAMAIDLYERFVHVQEYEPPATVDPARADARLHAALGVIPEVLGASRAEVFLKVRRRQKGRAQYTRHDETGEMYEVHEGGYRFLVNLTDYLDTGLFLDHRLTRRRVGELAKGRHFLNLFAYTGTASVYAAGGGALSTTTVDLSNTYLDWASRNLALNGFRGARHELVRADCLQFLAPETRRYGLIFLDPPTFSNSKGMEDNFDVQRDHPALLRQAARLLEPDGVLLFSNNFRRFKMDGASLPEFEIEEITRATLPPDFAGNPRIHNAWILRNRDVQPR